MNIVDVGDLVKNFRDREDLNEELMLRDNRTLYSTRARYS